MTLIEKKRVFRKWAVGIVVVLLVICCGVGGLWYEEVLRDRREAEIMQETARASDEELDGAEGAESEECEPQVEILVESDPVVPKEVQCSTVGITDGQESLALVRSAVTMRLMCGSRTPGTVCCDPIVVCSPPRTGGRYAIAQENEFQNTRSEPLSTFGLDVDTTSYGLMRSSIVGEKRLPPKESVRIEEFVNYFKYDYPQPTGGEPIAVDCELAACPWNAKHRLLRVGVQAKTIDEAKLPPCNLTFLVDTSGSMAGKNRIELVKKALKMLVGKLRDEDHVAIVVYSNVTAVNLPSVSGREKSAICEMIDALRAGGGTAGGEGLELAYKEAQKHFDEKANNRVILVTDGDFNIGMSTPEELEKYIATKRDSGIFLTVLGVGRGNYQDAGMKKLANAGNGNYAYLDSLLEAKKVMMNEFGGTLMTVAKDVKVQIEFNPSEVAGYRLLGYENRMLKAHEFNDDKKDAGEIGAGHTMTAFYEIVPGEVVGKSELFTVKTRYKLPQDETSVLMEKAHAAEELRRKEPSEDFRFASAVAEFALLLKDSTFKGSASYTNLIERARNAKGTDREGLRAEFVRLAETAELMTRVKASPPQKIKYGHVDGCYGDAPTEGAVVKALRELKQAQADDGSWGTNKVADTAWAVLTFLSHGETPGGSREFGETVQKGVEFLIDAAETVSEPDVSVAAYALSTVYDMTRNPNAYDSTVGLFRRMKTAKSADTKGQLLRTEACRLALWATRKSCVRSSGDLVKLADEMWPALMAWWKAYDAQGEEVAYKCRALMLADGEFSDEAMRLVDRMRGWKPDDERCLTAAFCAALCKYNAGMRVGARQEDVSAWIEWNRAMKQYLQGKLANAKDVSEKSQIILQLTVSYRYRRSLPCLSPSPCNAPRQPEVKVEVDI